MPTNKTFGRIAIVSCEPGYTKQGVTFHLKCNMVTSANSDVGEWSGPFCEGEEHGSHTLEEAFDASNWYLKRKQNS